MEDACHIPAHRDLFPSHKLMKPNNILSLQRSATFCQPFKEHYVPCLLALGIRKGLRKCSSSPSLALEAISAVWANALSSPSASGSSYKSAWFHRARSASGVQLEHLEIPGADSLGVWNLKNKSKRMVWGLACPGVFWSVPIVIFLVYYFSP